MARRRLGRGLDGLLPAGPPPSRQVGDKAPIEEVHPRRAQPRKTFAPAGLAELAASIVEHGVLEPILVRKRARGGFEIIAGERRWRAAQRAGLKEVPIFVHDLSDGAAFEAALVENLQREDLNPVETARAFQRLIDEYGHTQEQVATRVGKDRSTVTNALRLLKLPSDVLELVEGGALSEGHGRAVLGAPNVATIRKLAKDTASKGWSVRELERRVRASGQNGASKASTKAAGKSANVRDLERKLAGALGSSVSIQETKKGEGRLVISFASYDELDGIVKKITRR